MFYFTLQFEFFPKYSNLTSCIFVKIGKFFICKVLTFQNYGSIFYLYHISILFLYVYLINFNLEVDFKLQFW